MEYKWRDKHNKLEDIQILNDAINVWDNTHYDKKAAGDYSATSIIDTVRVVQLKKRYGDELYVPVESKINAFFGTGVHEMYEAALKDNPDYELEKRMVVEYRGRKLTGKFDALFQKQHVYDFKTTKAWKLVFDPDLEEWHQQQNIYAWLLHKNGYDIKSLNIIAHYYDWSQNSALRDKTYPQRSVVEYELSLWDYDETEQMVYDLVDNQIRHEETPDDDLPACSAEDRWERFPGGGTKQYALLKTRESKRATKLFTSERAAREHGQALKTHGADSVIEVRHAQRKRCEKYCSVAHRCNHHQVYMEKKRTGTLNDYVSLY